MEQSVIDKCVVKTKGQRALLAAYTLANESNYPTMKFVCASAISEISGNLFPEEWGIGTPEEAEKFIEEAEKLGGNAHALKETYERYYRPQFVDATLVTTPAP